ncbi:MAG: hypothetical protein ABR532_05225 [Candidatus Dormibacteria bacterium]
MRRRDPMAVLAVQAMRFRGSIAVGKLEVTVQVMTESAATWEDDDAEQ